MVTSVMIVVKHLIYGGTEKYTLNLVNALANRKISVILVTSGGPLTEYISPEVKVFIMPISRKLRIKQITEKNILKLARIYKPQIIHTQCRTSLICVQNTRNFLNIPVISNEHHIYDQSDYPFIIDEIKNGADKIITTGPYAAKELIKHGLEKDKVVTILNGVDVKKILPVTVEERKLARKFFNLNESDKVIVCLSRIEPVKGIDRLARGFIKVAKEIPESKLIIIGDDQQNLVKPYLKEIINTHNLQGRFFIFPGEYDIRKYHAVADVFCYPAIAKGMAVMEAMAAGLPIIIPPPKEGFSEGLENIVVFSKRDPESFAKSINMILSDLNLQKTFSEKSQKKAIEFDSTKIEKREAEIYHELLSSHL